MNSTRIQHCSQGVVRMVVWRVMATSSSTKTGPATTSAGAGGKSTSHGRLQYRPKPYRTLQQIAEDSERARIAHTERNSKENVPPSSGIGSGWLSSRRLCVAPDFVLDPVKDAPSRCKAPSESPLRPFNEKRYCCSDCYRWYHDPRDSKDEAEAHIQRTARHRQPRCKTPPGIWDIDFPDSD